MKCNQLQDFSLCLNVPERNTFPILLIKTNDQILSEGLQPRHFYIQGWYYTEHTDTAANNVHLFCIYYMKGCVCCKCLLMQQQQKNAILHLRMFAGNLQLW